VLFTHNKFLSASEFNQDIGGWDVAAVTDMKRMVSARNEYVDYGVVIANYCDSFSFVIISIQVLQSFYLQP
jgi:bacterial surface protein 26-residue repeat